MSGCVYFMCVRHWHEVEHTVMLYVQKMADPSDSVQLLPHLVDHQNSVKNPIVNTYLLILSSYHVTNRK